MSEALGQQVNYNAVPPATFRGFGFPGAEDLGFRRVGLGLYELVVRLAGAAS